MSVSSRAVGHSFRPRRQIFGVRDPLVVTSRLLFLIFYVYVMFSELEWLRSNLIHKEPRMTFLGTKGTWLFPDDSYPCDLFPDDRVKLFLGKKARDAFSRCLFFGCFIFRASFYPRKKGTCFFFRVTFFRTLYNRNMKQIAIL